MRLALVGCGAVAQRCYVPALRQLDLRPQVVVDPDAGRAQAIAEAVGSSRYSHDVSEILRDVDAAIVATPPSSHAEIATELLANGIHVLLEKPMATTVEECDRLVEATADSPAVLAIGLMRRHAYATRWVDALLRAGFRDELESVDVREGFVFDWPLASDYLLHHEQAGGGVLADIGPHVLDLALMWLGPPNRLTYFDDCFGGVEADCEVYLGFAAGFFAYLELSRTRKLRNSAVLRGPDWTLEVPLYGNKLRASPRSLLRSQLLGQRGDRLPDQTITDLFAAEIADWLNAIASGTRPAAAAHEGRTLVELVNWCYRERRPLAMPWMPPLESQSDLSATSN